MMRPVAAYVGLRYLRTHRSNHFVSFVTLASVIGVALGVAALIVVLSVMNGFENELRGRLLSMMGHARVMPVGQEQGWLPLVDDLGEFPGIVAAAPFIELEAMLASGRELSGALVTGVDPALEGQISEVREHMRTGSLDDLVAGQRGAILGRALALKLGLQPGDAFTIMAPRKARGAPLKTGLAEFTVTGIFELGLRDHDSVRVLVHLDDAAALGALRDSVTGVRVRTADVFAAPAIVRDWAESQQPAPLVRDWTEDNATYFRAVHIEKIMMSLLLSLIVAVAAFNIVATLVMVVTDKRSGIAILRTFGFSRRVVVGIFAVQGLVVGWIGVACGVFLGVFMALNTATLAPRLERWFGFEFMPADVYYLTALPSELQISDVTMVCLAALVLTGLATIYPAVRAASVAPAEVLRYE